MTRRCLAVAALAGACNGSLPAPCEDGSCGSQVSTKTSFQRTINRQLDLLFVIDDTSAIAPYAAALATGLGDIAQRFPIGAPTPDLEISLHAGFVRAGTCDASTRGSACGVSAPDQFVRSEYCNTVTNFNYGDGLPDAFTCLGDLGAANCGPAQPLAAALGWLAGPARAGWEGFLRPDAYLMIVVVATTDDASGPPGSPTPVVAMANTLKSLKPDPSQVLVSVLGPTGCVAGDMPDPRLHEFVNQFGANGLYLPLCGGDLGAALDRVVSYVGDFAPPCLRKVRDMDPGTPGLQASCVAESHSLQPDHSIRNAPLPLCDDSPPPCLHLAPSGGFCDGYSPWVENTLDWCVAAGINFSIECISCADPNDPACVPVR
jgi:hypothetical protein